MAPDLRLREPAVAKGVIPMPMGVDHPADPLPRQLAQLLAQLLALLMRRPGINDQNAVVADDDSDVETERLVPPAIDAFIELVKHLLTLSESWCVETEGDEVKVQLKSYR